MAVRAEKKEKEDTEQIEKERERREKMERSTAARAKKERREKEDRERREKKDIFEDVEWEDIGVAASQKKGAGIGFDNIRERNRREENSPSEHGNSRVNAHEKKRENSRKKNVNNDVNFTVVHEVEMGVKDAMVNIGRYIYKAKKKQGNPETHIRNFNKEINRVNDLLKKGNISPNRRKNLDKKLSFIRRYKEQHPPRQAT